MGSTSRPKKTLLAEKLSLPAALGLWVLSFYAGYLYGGNQLEKLPDIRVTSKVPVGVQKIELELQSHKEDSTGEILEDGGRQELAKVEPKPPAILSDHGESGEGVLSEIPYQCFMTDAELGSASILFPKFCSQGEMYGNSGDRQKVYVTFRPSPTARGNSRKYRRRSYKAFHYIEVEKSVGAISHLSNLIGGIGGCSSGTFLSSHGDPSGALAWVENKMAKVTMVPVTHGEAYNVLRYELGQKYNSHYDTFNPEEYGPQTSQRIASFLLYLTDVEEGGETMFPFEGFRNMDIGYDFTKCIGLTVKPKQGDALLFWSVFPNGTIDKVVGNSLKKILPKKFCNAVYEITKTSLHGSCPVIKGEKWVATKWIRDKPMRMW